MESENFMTQCSICEKYLEWKQELFEEGGTGEPVCQECKDKGLDEPVSEE